MIFKNFLLEVGEGIGYMYVDCIGFTMMFVFFRPKVPIRDLVGENHP